MERKQDKKQATKQGAMCPFKKECLISTLIEGRKILRYCKVCSKEVPR